MTATATASNGKVKQRQLPGADTPKNDRIERAARKYVKVRNSRMEMLEEEGRLRQKLEIIMHEEGYKVDQVYEHDDCRVELTRGAEKAKVKIGSDDDGGDEEGTTE